MRLSKFISGILLDVFSALGQSIAHQTGGGYTADKRLLVLENKFTSVEERFNQTITESIQERALSRQVFY